MPVVGNFLQIRYDTYIYPNSICTEGTSYSHGLKDSKYKWIKIFTPIMMKEKTTNLCLKSKDRKNKDHLEKYKRLKQNQVRQIHT